MSVFVSLSLKIVSNFCSCVCREPQNAVSCDILPATAFHPVGTTAVAQDSRACAFGVVPSNAIVFKCRGHNFGGCSECVSHRVSDDTGRCAITAIGVPPQNFRAISMYGSEWQAAAVFSSFVNHPLPPVPMGGRAEIAIAVIEQPAMMPMQPFAIVPECAFAMPGAESTAMVHTDVEQADHFNRMSSDIDAAMEDDSEYEDDGALLSDDMMFI